MGAAVDIDLLKTFVAVCDTASFTAAAKRVGRTQSAVSLQIRRLEASLGRPLFVRGAAGVEPTEHGVLLLGHANGILARVGEAVAAFGRGGEAGVVVLGMPSDYAPRILPLALKAFAEVLPEATVDIVLDRSRHLVRRLAEGSVDLAFLSAGEGPVRGPAAFEDRLAWVSPAQGGLHLCDPLPLAIWEEGGAYETAILESLEAMGRASRVVVVSRHIIGLRAAVTAGLAATVMVGSSVVPGMRVLGPDDGFQTLRQVVVHLERTHQRRSAIVDRLAEHLLQRLAG